MLVDIREPESFPESPGSFCLVWHVQGSNQTPRPSAALIDRHAAAALAGAPMIQWCLVTKLSSPSLGMPGAAGPSRFAHKTNA